MPQTLTSDDSLVIEALFQHGHLGYQRLKHMLCNHPYRILGALERLKASRLIHEVKHGKDTHYALTRTVLS